MNLLHADAKIFLVDNDPSYLNILETHFKSLGYTQIETFSNSADCLNELHNQPDVIFLEHAMDNLNGIDILKKIKRFNPGLPVIFVSGQEKISIAVDALKYGAFDYITKAELSREKLAANMDKVMYLRALITANRRKKVVKTVFANMGLSFLVTLFLPIK